MRELGICAYDGAECVICMLVCMNLCGMVVLWSMKLHCCELAMWGSQCTYRMATRSVVWWYETVSLDFPYRQWYVHGMIGKHFCVLLSLSNLLYTMHYLFPSPLLPSHTPKQHSTPNLRRMATSSPRTQTAITSSSLCYLGSTHRVNSYSHMLHQSDGGRGPEREDRKQS